MGFSGALWVRIPYFFLCLHFYYIGYKILLEVLTVKKLIKQKKKVLISIDEDIYNYYENLGYLKGISVNKAMVAMLENTMLTAKALTEGGVIDQLKAIYKSI